jgi:hypothetical protein
LAVVLGGCVPSLHPLYTDKDVVFEEKLLGSWEDGESIWKFDRGTDANSYDLTVVTDGNDGRFIANLVKLNGTMFLDLYPGPVEIKANDFYKAHLLAAHTFIKVEHFDPNLSMRMMDPEKLEKLIESKPDIIKHELVEKRIILTASTAHLQAFIKKYQNDPNVFGEPSIMKRIIVNEPNEPNDLCQK